MKKYFAERIEISPDEHVERILFENCQYKHFLYNEFVKCICVDNVNGFISYNKYNTLSVIRSMYEKTNDNRPAFLKKYDYYFRGISAYVACDIQMMVDTVISNRQRGIVSNISFKSFDLNNQSFSFENKVNRSRGLTRKGVLSGNRIVLTDNPFIIGVKINKNYQYPLGIRLKESIFKLMNKNNWCIDDIRSICFKYHNNKWFINLAIEDNRLCDTIMKHRKKICGIDLGETNPVMMYDGNIVKIPKHLQYPKATIDKVNKHIQNCKAVMNRKYNPDMDKFHQSKNYYKVLRKFHKYHERKNNIIKDWHFKLAHWIVTHYRNIVVDEFRNHIIPIKSKHPTRLRKRCNRSMYDKSMYNFNQRLIHMCKKYGTNYFKPITKETTNTCSKCGNVNINKLRIDENHNERIFKCECCGFKQDRDINASINCYTLYKDKCFREMFLELI